MVPLIANHVKAEGFLFDESGKITGVVARDLLTDQVFEIKARLVINTTGPWSDKVRNLSNKGTQFSQMRPTKGVHLVVDSSKIKVSQPFTLTQVWVMAVWSLFSHVKTRTYFGTTDTDYTGDLEHPKVTQEDVDYLLGNCQ